MSSWLARSLANSLRLDGDGENENDVVSDPPTTSPRSHQPHDNAVGSEEEEGEEQGHGRGVKEDLDEIKQTLTRQFWGMASFLAPPPSISQPSSPPSHSHSPNQQQHRDVDLASIPDQSRRDSSDAEQGRLHVDDPDPIGSDSEGNGEPEIEDYALERAVGITEEVLAFAMNIAMHPETWLDFPIDEEDDPQGNPASPSYHSCPSSISFGIRSLLHYYTFQFYFCF